MRRMLTLFNLRDARRYYDEGVWTSNTLYSRVLHHASTRPDDYALRDAALRITWRQLLQWADAVAEQLRQAGLRAGERVAVWMPSRAESMVMLAACAQIGRAHV